ncbi:MAG: TIGR04086 family membrane protein [Clostridia bacterium]|nr:TIGR04086 family membrane protein [Clostridia bacterium]
MFESKNSFLSLLKAVVISILFSLLAVLIFAFIISVCSLDGVVIKPVNYLIKCIAVFLGCFFSIKGEKGLIKGAVFGGVIAIICYTVFSLISNSFSFSLTLLWEVLLGIAIGAITGIIAVNRK